MKQRSHVPGPSASGGSCLGAGAAASLRPGASRGGGGGREGEEGLGFGV